MKWVNALHLYQPPTQSHDVVKHVTNESYNLIASLIEKYPHIRMTLNISGSLLELLENSGHYAVIQRFKKLHDQGEIELLGSAMYHPILPLLPAAEIERQIALNTEIIKKYFGQDFMPKGFYLPEMAYSKEVAEVIKKMGFEWVLLDDAGHFPSTKAVPHSSPASIYEIKDVGLKAVFRNRVFSRTFPPEYILDHLNDIKDNILITVHDGELYGHWHKDDKGFYQKIFNMPDIQTQKVSEYLSELEKNNAPRVVLEPWEGNWEMTEEERKLKNHFALWKHPENSIQKKLWDLAHIALSIVEKKTKDQNYLLARNALDKGLASCAWWWASQRKLGPFSPVTWNPTEIEKGATMLLTAVRSLDKLAVRDYMRAEKKANSLRETVWKKHWQLYSKEKRTIEETDGPSS